MAKVNLRAIKKTFSLLMAVSLLLQQTGFAQVVQQLDFGRYLAGTKAATDIFRPMHLRYFAYDNLGESFNLLLDKGDNKNVNDDAVREQSKVVFNYFLTGISLPNDTFWVNLRPDAENQIIDDRLAKTDMGKVMLAADVQLKKDLALFTSPQNPKGKVYWDRLYKKAGELFGADKVSIPTLTRPWIAPDEVIVRYTSDSAYVYKASLKVALEQDLLKDSAAFKFNDPRLKTLNDYSSQLIRELIIPELTKEVNTAKRYAGLRQVFYSLILAQCFKLKLNPENGIYAKRANSGDLTGLTSATPWSRSVYYKEYKQSFKDGEYNVKQVIPSLAGQVIRSYSSGGVKPLVPSEAAATTFVQAAREHIVLPAPMPGHAAVVADDTGMYVQKDGSAGFGGQRNEDFNADMNPALQPPFAGAFSAKATIPYAEDNAVYRTKEGRDNMKQHMRKVLDHVERNVRTVVFGKVFLAGEQVKKRGSADANLPWTDMLRERHPLGAKYLLAQKEYTQKGFAAWMRGDYPTFIDYVNNYVDSRTATNREWLSLMLQARKGVKGLPLWVYERLKVLKANPKEYKNFLELFEEIDEGGAPADYDLYAPGDIGIACEAVRKFNAIHAATDQMKVAVFPVGAGGAGTVSALVGTSPEANQAFLDYLKANYEDMDVPEMITQEQRDAGKAGITQQEVEDLTAGGGRYENGTGYHKLAFWVSAKADVDGVKMNFDQWNENNLGIALTPPEELPWVLVNKKTLQIKLISEVTDAAGNVLEKYSADEWMVAKSWDTAANNGKDRGFDWRKFFRLDRPVMSQENIELIKERINQGGLTQGRFKQLRGWALKNNRKIHLSIPSRWLDIVGSSWDLKDFRLSGTPEGDLTLEMLPSCNAIPSEYRLEMDITAITDENVFEYEAPQYFKGVHKVNPNKEIHADRIEERDGKTTILMENGDVVSPNFEGLIWVKHSDPLKRAQGIEILVRKEKDIPAFVGKLFGFTGGLRFTCTEMNVVPRQGGMESGNAVVDVMVAFFSRISGANFTIPAISYISHVIQMNEENTLTGNQGADAAWAGAGLHVYFGGMRDMHAKRNFAATLFNPGTGQVQQAPLQYEAEHPVWGVTSYTVAVEQQNINLTVEQLQVLQDAQAMLLRYAQELIDNNTLILFNMAGGRDAHRSLGRAQLELDVNLLKPGNEKEVAIRLWHEAVERQAILGAIDGLGLRGQFDLTRLDSRKREMTLVTVNGRQMTLTEVVDELAAYVHKQLREMADIFYVSAPERDPAVEMQKRLKAVNLKNLGLLNVPDLVTDAAAAVRSRGDQGSGEPPSIPPPSSGGGPGSTPSVPGVPEGAGGIEFRRIDWMVQYQKSNFKADFKMPDLKMLKHLDLIVEKEQLDDMFAAKIIPSTDRMINYASACCLREGPLGMSDAMACLTGRFKLEEERGVQTDPQLKSFLFFMESSRIR